MFVGDEATTRSADVSVHNLHLRTTPWSEKLTPMNHDYPAIHHSQPLFHHDEIIIHHQSFSFVDLIHFSHIIIESLFFNYYLTIVYSKKQIWKKSHYHYLTIVNPHPAPWIAPACPQCTLPRGPIPGAVQVAEFRIAQCLAPAFTAMCASAEPGPGELGR